MANQTFSVTSFGLGVAAGLAGILLSKCIDSRNSHDGHNMKDMSRKLMKNELFKELAMQGGTHDMVQTIDHILEKARRLVTCEASSLFLVDKEHNELYSLAISGQQMLRISMSKGIAGTVAKTGNPMVIADAYKSSYFNPDIDSKTGFKTKNVCCLPIHCNDGSNTIIGVVQLLNKVDAKGESTPFTQEDLWDLQELTLIASVFIWNTSVSEFNHWAEQESSALIRSMNRLSSFRGRSSTIRSSPRASFESPAKYLGMVPKADDTVKLRSVLDFDVLDYHVDPNRRDLLVPLIVTMWKDLGFVDHFGFSEDRLVRLALALRSQYRSVPYHNFAHGFDVAHCVYGFFTIGKLGDEFSPIEKLSVFIAALFHDADHHGLNNAFHLRSHHPSSILLDATSSEVGSVLEIHHCNIAIEVLTDPSIELLDILPEQERAEVWRTVIACILATDMKEHQNICEDARQLGTSRTSNKVLMLQLLLKAADISNVTRPHKQATQWSAAVQNEFFVQGDKERELGMEVLPMFDRYSNIDQSGFIKGLAIPYFSLIQEIFPSLGYLVEGVLANEKAWMAHAEESTQENK